MRSLLILALGLFASPAAAQVWAPAPGQDSARWEADRHRAHMDALRAQADSRQAMTDRIAAETALARLRLQAQAAPPPVQPDVWYAVPAPYAVREAPASVSARMRTLGGRSGQIDAWLDRSRD